MNVAALLKRAGVSHRGLPALARHDASVRTFGELAHIVAVMAANLRRMSAMTPGERVALFMTNTPEYVEILFAAWHAGLVVVPINAKLHPSEVRYMLEHSGARLCFVTSDLAEGIVPLVSDLPELNGLIVVGGSEYNALTHGEPMAMEHRDGDDLAWLFYTSGTTGLPKGAMLSHRNLLAMTMSYLIDVDQIAPGDAVIHAAPMSHGSGLYSLPHVMAGACQVIPASGHFDPAEIFDLLNRYGGVSFFAAPTMVRRLIDHPGVVSAKLANLKSIIYGGGPMYVEDCRRALTVLGDGKLVQIYGQGESPMTISALSRRHHGNRAHPRWDDILASVGTVQTAVEVRIADDDGNTVPAGMTGEVLVRGETVMLGYWRDPENTAKTLEGGWLHTGDMGAMDSEGFLTLRDRSKDVIISGGTNIYPREVEEVLLSHEGVAEVSVIGKPEPEWGEDVAAFIVCRPGKTVTMADLDELCLSRMARFKRPKHYRFIEALPKNNYGKVLKTELRKML